MNEKRRLRDWASLRQNVVNQIQGLTGPMFEFAQLQGQLDTTEGFNPEKWVRHLREILSRATARSDDGILSDADMWNRDIDTGAIMGATAVGLKYAQDVSDHLTGIQLLFKDSLPMSTQQLLAESVFAAQRAARQVQPIGPNTPPVKRDFDIQATTNARAMVALFEALLLLLDNVSTARIERTPRRGL